MKLVPLLVAATSLLGCVDQSPNLGSTAGESFEQYLAQVQREPGTGRYILDWDIAVSSAADVRAVWEQSQQGALAIYSVGGTDIRWTPAQALDLRYCISNRFTPTQKTAVVAAMAEASDQGWELFANVNYKYVPGEDANCTAANTNVLFDVNPITGAQYLARSFFPNSVRAERNVMIDSTAFTPETTGGISLGRILTHELGHTLGFRHEHIARPGQNLPGCVEDADFRLIGAYDQTSTMHYPQCGSPGNTLALSAQDKTGVATIYGAARVNVAPMAQVTAPNDGSTVGPSFSVDASVVDDDLQSVELIVDDAPFATVTTGPYTFALTGMSLGLHNLELVATDTAGLSTSRPFTVTVSRTGPTTGTGSGDNGDPSMEGADATGGCNAGGVSGGGLLVLLGLAGMVRRRRPLQA